MRKKFKLSILVLALFIAMSSIVTASPNENAAGAFDKKIITRIDSSRALEHIYILSKEIGPRTAGTNEEWRAANYIQNQLQRWGYSVEIQEFPINNIVSQLFMIFPDYQEFQVTTATGSGHTDADGITGKIVDCGLGLTSDDFPDEVVGNIALIKRGEATFALKTENAVNAGAAGVIIYNNVEGILRPTLGDYDSPIPVVAITLEDGEFLYDALQQEEIQVKIRSQRFMKSWNVVAVKEPKNKNKNSEGIIYVTAHYDSVPYAPGANDNASGISMMLEFARILREYPVDKEVRFIAFGAEEIGLVGSRAYVAQLSEDEISRSVANFNMDMIATSWEPASLIYINTVDGSHNIVSEAAVSAGARLGNDTLFLNQGGSSDHVSFHSVGIDAANFIRREPETGRLEPWYHTPDDTIEINISEVRLQEAGQIIGSALYDLLRMKTANLGRSRIRMPIEELEIFCQRGDEE